MADVVMVPVPEELVDEVRTFLRMVQFRTAGTGWTADLVDSHLNRMPDDARALACVVAQRVVTGTTPDDAELSVQFGISKRDLFASAQELNEIVIEPYPGFFLSRYAMTLQIVDCSPCRSLAPRSCAPGRMRTPASWRIERTRRPPTRLPPPSRRSVSAPRSARRRSASLGNVRPGSTRHQEAADKSESRECAPHEHQTLASEETPKVSVWNHCSVRNHEKKTATSTQTP